MDWGDRFGKVRRFQLNSLVAGPDPSLRSFHAALSLETFEAQGLRLLQRRHRRRRLPVQNFHLGSRQGRARTGLGLSRVGARQTRSQGFRLMNNGGRTQRSYKVCQKKEEGVERREVMALLCDDECRQPRQVYCLTKMGKP